MITPRQMRAARALLGWTVADLADHSGLAASTIHRTETSKHVPEPVTLKLIQRALEDHGVEFLVQDGVRMSKEKRE